MVIRCIKESNGVSMWLRHTGLFNMQVERPLCHNHNYRRYHFLGKINLKIKVLRCTVMTD